MLSCLKDLKKFYCEDQVSAILRSIGDIKDKEIVIVADISPTLPDGLVADLLYCNDAGYRSQFYNTNIWWLYGSHGVTVSKEFMEYRSRNAEVILPLFKKNYADDDLNIGYTLLSDMRVTQFNRIVETAHAYVIRLQYHNLGYYDVRNVIDDLVRGYGKNVTVIYGNTDGSIIQEFAAISSDSGFWNEESGSKETTILGGIDKLLNMAEADGSGRNDRTESKSKVSLTFAIKNSLGHTAVVGDSIVPELVSYSWSNPGQCLRITEITQSDSPYNSPSVKFGALVIPLSSIIDFSLGIEGDTF